LTKCNKYLVLVRSYCWPRNVLLINAVVRLCF
jgi:hypothetical protein